VKLLDTTQGTALRVLLRALVVCATAFGLGWTAEQVAAVQLVTEAVLGVLVRATPDKETP
jgi:hypothetical protein